MVSIAYSTELAGSRGCVPVRVRTTRRCVPRAVGGMGCAGSSQKSNSAMSGDVILRPEEERRMAERLSHSVSPRSYATVLRAVAVFKRRQRAARAARGLGHEAGSSALGGADETPPTSPSKAAAASREDGIQAGVRLLEQRCSAHGMEVREVGGDGNCQFRSFSHQLYGTEDAHASVREKAVAHIRQHRDFYGMFFEGDSEFETYCRNMASARTWGDELTLKAVGDAFGCTVHVVTSTEENWHLEYAPEEAKIDKICFLLYISPIHYNSVVNLEP